MCLGAVGSVGVTHNALGLLGRLRGSEQPGLAAAAAAAAAAAGRQGRPGTDPRSASSLYLSPPLLPLWRPPAPWRCPWAPSPRPAVLPRPPAGLACPSDALGTRAGDLHSRPVPLATRRAAAAAPGCPARRFNLSSSNAACRARGCRASGRARERRRHSAAGRTTLPAARPAPLPQPVG